MEKSGGEVQNPIVCIPCCRYHRQEAYRHEEAKENSQLLLQLHGLLFTVSPGPGGHIIQIPADRLWPNGPCSDTQIFNRSLLREKIKDGSLGLPPPEPLGEGGPGPGFTKGLKQKIVITLREKS